MFLPFRSWDDPCTNVECEDSTYWTKFQTEIGDGGKFWKTGIDILHNIQDRTTAHNTKRAVEPLVSETVFRQNEDDESTHITASCRK